MIIDIMNGNNINQAVDKFEEENGKFELAMEIAGGDREKAQKLISGEIKNIAAIKGAFKDEAVNLKGLFIFFINLETKTIERNFTVISFDESLQNMPPYLKWSELERRLIDLEWGGKNLTNQSSDLKTDIQSTITFEYMDKIIVFIGEGKEKEINTILTCIISKSLNLEAVNLTIGIELINKFFIAFEGHTEKKEDVKENKKDEEVKEEGSNEVILEGMLEISPVKGINITQLEPGTTILIRLPDKTSKDKYYLNLLNAFNEDKVIPIPAVVRNVEYDEISGYLVVSGIAPGLVVKCIEQAQINIMTPEIAEKSRKAKNIRTFLFMLGSFILLLVGIYLYLYFRGII